jgi:outer membrane autotransporter protein
VKTGSGILTLTGTNTYTGPTTVNGGALVVNGSLLSAVTLNGGRLGGSGSIGGLIHNGGVLAPGNSIGTLTIAGDFSQNGGVYQVEANGQGQSDRVNAGGTATIGGGAMVQVLGPGIYRRPTTNVILNATGGVSGTYSGVTTNLAFVVPSLSYDANNVYLILSPSFAAGARTTNQRGVASALDRAGSSATGDFGTVLDALSGLNTEQGAAALTAISGQPIANFGTVNLQGGALFMSTVGQQMGLARSGAGGGRRVALAEACEISACEGAASPWGGWMSAVGGLGSVAGNGNASTLTYNFGGTAVGLDYRFNANFLMGVSVGYAHGTQWVSGFNGQGMTDTVNVAAYASFTQAGFYADALAGYAYSSNQIQRQIILPGLQPRTASGNPGANQFVGQLETGYQVGLWAPARASITPFAGLQASTVTQNGFSESGAQSLGLDVSSQTTRSLRTTFGAELAGTVPLDNERQLDLALRLGWQHELADTTRPMTAAFAGAPQASFTVYGVSPQRDAAILSLSGRSKLSDATELYLRYDGQFATGTDNHALNAGVRFTW